MNALEELKTRAEILHHRMQAGDQNALGRLRALPTYRKATEQTLTAAPPSVRRSDCLSVIARELGFPGWTEARTAVSGEGPIDDFGSFLYPKRGGGLNLWFKTYQEAADVRAEKGGYLLAYRRQYLVVEYLYIEALGLDPNDPDWAAIGFDWVQPLDPSARMRLCGKLIAARPRVTH